MRAGSAGRYGQSITCFWTSEGRKAQTTYARLGRSAAINSPPPRKRSLFSDASARKKATLIDKLARASVVGGADGWSLTRIGECKERLYQDYIQQ